MAPVEERVPLGRAAELEVQQPAAQGCSHPPRLRTPCKKRGSRRRLTRNRQEVQQAYNDKDAYKGTGRRDAWFFSQDPCGLVATVG